MSALSTQTELVEEGSSDDQCDLEDEKNDLIVAIAGAIAAEAIQLDDEARWNEDTGSDEDSSP